MVPVYEEILMDLETPVSFYNRLKKSRHSFLLESVEGSERWARYSFLGTAPELIFKAWGHEVEITRGRKKESRTCDDPLKALAEILDGYQPATTIPDLPFTGGALGYVAYDAVEMLHGVPNTAGTGQPLSGHLFPAGAHAGELRQPQAHHHHHR